MPGGVCLLGVRTMEFTTRPYGCRVALPVPHLLAALHEAVTVRVMEAQHQVRRRLRADPGRVRGVLDNATSQGITSLGLIADRVCEALHLGDGRGRWQRASCRKELGMLQARGDIALPAPRRSRAGGHGPRVLAHAVAPAHDVPGTVGAECGLVLVRVETDAQRLAWNTLMAHEHRRGAGPLVGHQVRYLVGSAHGWLGAEGFAAWARRLDARDVWMGWEDAERCAHLHRAVGLCRFLIRRGAGTAR